MDIYERMSIETRQGKLDSTRAISDTTETNRATPDLSTNCEPDRADPNIDSLSVRKLLLQILNNKKIFQKEIGRTKQVNDAKAALDVYTAENDREIAAVKTSVNTTIADLKGLQDKLTSLETQLTATTSKLVHKRAKAALNTVGELDENYMKDEEESDIRSAYRLGLECLDLALL